MSLNVIGGGGSVSPAGEVVANSSELRRTLVENDRDPPGEIESFISPFITFGALSWASESLLKIYQMSC